MASADAPTRAAAAVKVQSGTLDRSAPALPAAAADQLISYAAAGDPLLTVYLAALHRAGWSYGALSAPLGCSRQAVHLRLAKYIDDGKPHDLPPVPPGPGRSRQSASDRFDWAIWVDRDTYAVAAAHANSLGQSMQSVMEQILRDFINGALTVAADTPSEDRN